MSVLKLLVLPGDGIGPEVTESALEVLDVVAKRGNLTVEIERADFGGASIDAHGVPMTDDVLKLARESTAVLLGAVGGPNGTHSRLISVLKRDSCNCARAWGFTQISDLQPSLTHFWIQVHLKRMCVAELTC